MGFMGLDSWIESDDAADFRGSCYNALFKLCEKELKDDANEYNTPGFINIALLLETGIFNDLSDYELDDHGKILLECWQRLDHTYKTHDWERDAIGRMRDNVAKYLEERGWAIN